LYETTHNENENTLTFKTAAQTRDTF
jgi:hypothetical protein